MHNNFDIPTLGIDLDGTIDEYPLFFRTLSNSWPGRVVIITYRKNQAAAEERAKEFGIKFDELILATSMDDKAKIIKRENIGAFFDDMDEFITHIPDSVPVFKVRNGGNFENGKWIYSSATGIHIDDM